MQYALHPTPTRTPKPASPDPRDFVQRPSTPPPPPPPPPPTTPEREEDKIAEEYFPFISSGRFTLKEFVQEPRRWFWFTGEWEDWF